TEKFRKAFLTEAEQLAPIQQMVTDTLKKLGFANVDTMEEFKQLVQSIKPVTPEAAQLQNTLLELAPAFEKVYKGADDLLENLRKETINLTTTLSADEIILRDITIKTNEYVETLKASGVATEKNIKIVADWAKASALTQLRNNLKSAYEDRKRELESSISALEKVKNSLVDFKTQLLRGELSPESTLSKFEQLRAEYDVLLQDVRSSDSSVAEKAAEKFPQLSTQLLDTAKTLYGSGELYQTLHDKILKDLDTTTTIVNTKLTDAQQQLEELTKQGVTLGFIEQNTKTTAEKFSEYLRLYNAVNAINTATVGANAAAAIASGNTVNSSMLNAYQNELITNIPEIKITPLELTSEAAAAKKKADEEAAAAAAAKKKADEEAAAAAKKSNELAQELKNAIDAQTAILTTVISNTGSDTVTAVKNNTWIKTGTFGVVMEER
ncbi:MAG: hypothetical protein EBU12_03265, partial [Microbacteriaceae bacterium]|nr:hypothetical protein [Microbacteriaceae bacterium]